jgi:hypothetical protein
MEKSSISSTNFQTFDLAEYQNLTGPRRVLPPYRDGSYCREWNSVHACKCCFLFPPNRCLMGSLMDSKLPKSSVCLVVWTHADAEEGTSYPIHSECLSKWLIYCSITDSSVRSYRLSCKYLNRDEDAGFADWMPSLRCKSCSAPT